jgi:hypothetical protein
MADDNDEDLQKAIALSLMAPEQEPKEENVLLVDDDNEEEDDDDLDKPSSTRLYSARPRTIQTPRPPSESTHRTVIDLSTPVQLLPRSASETAPLATGLLGLNRRQMEEERLARTALRKRGEGDVSVPVAPARKRKASTSPILSQDRARQGKERSRNVPEPFLTTKTESELREPLQAASTLSDRGTLNHLHSDNETIKTRKPQSCKPTALPPTPHHEAAGIADTKARQYLPSKEPRQALARGGIQYPNGVVKKTWAFGYDRKGDDIKIEEVFQKNDLQLAVLSSFQIDADCMPSFSLLLSYPSSRWFVSCSLARSASKTVFFITPHLKPNPTCLNQKLILKSEF